MAWMDHVNWFALAFAGSVCLNGILLRMMLRLEPRTFRGNSKCPKCGYDVRATIGGQCPECGEPVRRRPVPPGMVTRCSFCGKSHFETGPQAEGPDDVYICAPCVELCHKVILKNRSTPTE
jgi:hypothetical protein